MYLDPGGNVTVGVGSKLSNVEEAVALPFIRRANQQAATPGEKRAEFNTLRGKEAGHAHTYYEQFCLLRLRSADIDALLLSELNTFEGRLRGIFPNYDAFPSEAQEALLDMIFNLGPSGFLRFNRLISAVRNQDWFLAAAESRRNGIPDGRNDEIRELFRAAGQRSRVFEGRWVGSVNPTNESPISVTLVITRVGSNAYTANMTYRNPETGAIETDPVTAQLDANRNVSFMNPDEPGDGVRGRINEAFTEMDGLLYKDNEVDGTFSFRKA